MAISEYPADYVISTGKLFSVRDLLQIAFDYVGLDYSRFVAVDYSVLRKVESKKHCGDSSKIQKHLGWSPTMGVKEVMQKMVEHELEAIKLSI